MTYARDLPPGEPPNRFVSAPAYLDDEEDKITIHFVPIEVQVDQSAEEILELRPQDPRVNVLREESSTETLLLTPESILKDAEEHSQRQHPDA